MRDKKMPDHRLECFGMRRHGFRIDLGTTTHASATLRCSRRRAYNARYLRADLPRILQSFDRLGLMFFSTLPPPTENTNTHRVQWPAGLKPLNETVAQPSSFRPGCSSETLPLARRFDPTIFRNRLPHASSFPRFRPPPGKTAAPPADARSILRHPSDHPQNRCRSCERLAEILRASSGRAGGCFSWGGRMRGNCSHAVNDFRKIVGIDPTRQRTTSPN